MLDAKIVTGWALYNPKYKRFKRFANKGSTKSLALAAIYRTKGLARAAANMAYQTDLVVVPVTLGAFIPSDPA